MKLQGNILLITIVICVDIYSIHSKKNSRKNIPRRPTHMQCVDRNLQRALIWKPPKPKRGFEFLKYEITFCPWSSCDTKTSLPCYKDDYRTIEDKDMTSPICKASIKLLAPWAFYGFEVRAVYSDKNSKKIIKSNGHEISCKPIESNMTLSSLTIDAETTKNTVAIKARLPGELVHAQAISDYDVAINYFFCLYKYGSLKKGETCTVTQNKCDSTMTYDLLEPGTEYTIQAWFKTLGSGRENIKSNRTTTKVTTEKDPFSDEAKITLVVSILGVFVICSLILMITKYLVNVWKKVGKGFSEDISHILDKKLNFQNLDEKNNRDLMKRQNWAYLQSSGDNEEDIPDFEIKQIKLKIDKRGSTKSNKSEHKSYTEDIATTHDDLTVNQMTSYSVLDKKTNLPPPPYVKEMQSTSPSYDTKANQSEQSMISATDSKYVSNIESNLISNNRDDSTSKTTHIGETNKPSLDSCKQSIECTKQRDIIPPVTDYSDK